MRLSAPLPPSRAYAWAVEKQPTAEELENARERARADAEERFAYETSGREPDDQPGDG